jgi:hypothetical protein
LSINSQSTVGKTKGNKTQTPIDGRKCKEVQIGVQNALRLLLLKHPIYSGGTPNKMKKTQTNNAPNALPEDNEFDRKQIEMLG